MRTKYLRAGEMDDHLDDMDAEDEEESILRLVDGDGDASTDEEASDDEQSGEEEDGGAHARGDTDPEDPQLARGHGASGPKTKPGAGKSQTSRPREPTRNPVRKYSKNTAKRRTNGTRAILDTSHSTDCKYDVLGGYVPSFIAHLKEARARVGVGAGPEASEEEDVSGHEAAGSIPTSPDTVSPDACTLSHWTSTEQTAFFRALSVYSRWRPDLVASCVPTKSVWEVGMYLEALEEGAARLATEEGEEGEEGEDKDQGSRRRRSRGVVERNGKGKKKGQADGDRDEDTDMGGSSSSSSSDTDEDTHLSPGLDSYRSYEPAHEVSQDWIDAEEVMASWVIHEDYLASLEKPAGSDAEQGEGGEHEPPKRKRGRPRGSGKGRGRGRPRTSGKSEADSRSQSASRSVHHSQSPKPTYHSSANPRSLSSSRKRALIPSDSPTRKRLKVEHRREVLMGHLEAAHLLVLDGISREGKETTRGRNKGKEDSVAEVSTYAVECRKEGELGAGAVVGMGASGEKQVQQGNGERTVNGLSNTENPPNAMIDPVLLALSGVTSDNGPTVPPAHIPGPSSEPYKPAQLVNMSSQPIPSPCPTSTPSQLGASNLWPYSSTSNIGITNPNPSTDPDLIFMSPRSRRRLQKRLYMRRRRAILRGDSIESEGALAAADKSKIIMGIEKFKPGKKAKAERGHTPVMSTSVPGSEEPTAIESEATKKIPLTIKGGLTLPYKLKAEFAALGVDATYLRARGMDLLHLGALGRLMGFYTSLEHTEDGQEEADEHVSGQSIDAKLIQHLQAVVVSFVTDVVHRAIVWKETEMRLKKRSRAWRHGDQIAPSAIEHAINVIGVRHHSHKEYFKSLLSFYGLSDYGDTQSSTKYQTTPPLADTEPSPLPAHASDNADPTGGSDARAEDGYSPPTLSLHRDIYTPVIRPPSPWGIDPLNCLSQTYMREATRMGKSQDMGQEELIPDETDEEVLEADLREEDELDRRDMRMAGKYEERLWDAVEQVDEDY